MREQQVDRRTVARGLAWSTPVVAVAMAAPAVAASGVVANTFLYSGRSGDWGCDRWYASTYRTQATTPSSQVYIQWSNTTTSMSFTNVAITYWYSSPSITWTTWTGHNACWSMLTRDTSQANIIQSGVTLYAYKSTYTCAITAASPTTRLPSFSFQSATCISYGTRPSSTWGYTFSYSLNGTPYTKTMFGSMA